MCMLTIETSDMQATLKYTQNMISDHHDYSCGRKMLCCRPRRVSSLASEGNITLRVYTQYGWCHSYIRIQRDTTVESRDTDRYVPVCEKDPFTCT